ncbi:MAG: AMP-binding protein [Clostridiales Family XIII bacterium]|jgi:acetyl-CoA synthetase|nr:AMP-binding protein [Clostridiales Family XIII bacterium]
MTKPWLEYRDFESYEDFRDNYKIDIPENFNFGFDCIDERALLTPDAPALIWNSEKETDEDRTYTFRELSELSDAAARYFTSLGIGKGDMVMLIMKRRAHFWFSILGLIKIGAVAIPATHHLTFEDISYRNNAAGVKAIISVDDAKVQKAIERSMNTSPGVKHLIRIGDELADAPFLTRKWENLDNGIRANLAGPKPLRVTENGDMMLLYFTSGTTGMPKMVLQNQLYALAHSTTAKYWHNLRPDSVHLTMSDTGWGKAAWGKLFGQWLVGCTVVVYDHEKLRVHSLLKIIEKNKITSFCAPPTVYKIVITADFRKYDLSALEYATSAGEPLNEEVFNKFLALTGIKIHEAYGQTETTAIVLTTPYTEPKAGSLGKPNPIYDLRFLDAEGREVPVGTEGEMCIVSNPGDLGVFMGYYQNAEMTEDAWAAGVYHTGDLAVMDEDGYITFIGRSDDIIKSAGYRIGPFEVESIVQEHPAVLECAVTGVPDPLRGQNIKVSIILNEGYEASDALSREIRAFVKANAAAYKIPRIIEFVGELPKTISGKVRRIELREKGEKNNE